MAKTDTLYRASFELQPAEGRTLVGIAMQWDTPSKVRDVIMGRVGPEYAEAFAPTSADATLAVNPARPVFVRHDYLQDPVGMSTFHTSREGLMFDAPLARTRRADEMLELVDCGAMRSVSVGFQPNNTIQRMFPGYGATKYRTGVILKELSLAPTGFGAYPGAGVLSVRDLTGGDDGDDDPGMLMASIDAVIDSALEALDPDGGCFNPAQAEALLTAAENAVDKLLDLFGVIDADDDDTADTSAMVRVAMHVGAMKQRLEGITATYSTAAAEVVEAPSVDSTPNLDAMKQRARRFALPPSLVVMDDISTRALMNTDDDAVGMDDKPEPGDDEPTTKVKPKDPSDDTSGEPADDATTEQGDGSSGDESEIEPVLGRDDGSGVAAGTSSDGTAPSTIETNVSRKHPGKPKDGKVDEATHAAMIGTGYSHIGRGTYQKGAAYVNVIPKKRLDFTELLTRENPHNWKGTGGLAPLDPNDDNPLSARYPIKTVADLHKAEEALGRAKDGDRAQIIDHIKWHAAQLGVADTLDPDIYGTE